MDILICGSCGYVGMRADAINVGLSEVKDNIKPGLYKIWKGLNIQCVVCPRCKSQHIGYIFEATTVWMEPTWVPDPIPQAPYITTVTNDGVTQSSTTLMDISKNAPAVLEDQIDDSVPHLEMDKVDPIGYQTKELPKPAIRPRAIYKERACDICGAPFITKVKGATRCDSCLKKTLRGMVPDERR